MFAAALAAPLPATLLVYVFVELSSKGVFCTNISRFSHTLHDHELLEEANFVLRDSHTSLVAKGIQLLYYQHCTDLAFVPAFHILLLSNTMT